MSYFNCHSHTEYSNIRLLDCINKPEDLIDKAIEIGLSGIAITDHECLSAHMKVNRHTKKIRETHPDFTVALGNEIYLVEERVSGQKYPHFLLIAKDATGHKALRELSSIAWYNSFVDRGMERVPTTKAELAHIVKKYRGHLIATTACMGGELSTALANGDFEAADEFIGFCRSFFGDDFYIECAPSANSDQIQVNQELLRMAQKHKIKLVIGTDAHYLTKEDRYVHKAYLNSKGGEREVDAFYEFSRLMDETEARQLLLLSFHQDNIVDWIFSNSKDLQSKITYYSLEREQMIPKINLPEYSEWDIYEYIKHIDWNFSAGKWPILKELYDNGNIQERYWLCECVKSLKDKGLQNDLTYWDRLETEADIIKYIGEKLDDCLFAYFNTFKHYIDLFWECGSIVGPGRGSATGFLSNYLLGITQLDPIRWSLPYWRFLNKERAELPDIDIDLAPSKRPAIFEAIRKQRGELGLIQVATFGTEGTKSAVLTACRGYRSGEYPDGIDVDQAQYMSSLIPQERGFLWPIQDVVYGNSEKDRRPVKAFIQEVDQYPGLLETIVSIEGLVNKRSCHASGVILYGEDPFETAGFMKTPGGDLITCYDLHDAEAAGDTKYDFLVTEISDKIIKCFELLQADGLIEKDFSIRQLYNKYIHPEVMNTQDQRIWDHLAAGDVLDVFQFSTGVGLAIAKKLKPQNPMEMTAANAMMRLMSERGKESQQDRYVRIQNRGLGVFEQEMVRAGFSTEQRAIMHKHCDQYWGCCALQEQMMELLMEVAGFTLGGANAARKIVGKKQMSKIPELKKQVYESFTDNKIADYFWENAIAPQLGYAFSLNHSLPYSFVGMQSIYFVVQFNPIYWNTACLIVNSGAMDEEAGGATDYGKIAKAIGDIRSAGIQVSLANINKSQFGFVPDVENNRILFGLKGMLNVGDDLVMTIIENRPYQSPKDFLYRVRPNKQAMIALIKGGAFDDMMDRKLCMAWYVWETCEKKTKLNLQNLATLLKYNLLPITDEYEPAYRVYEFTRYLKTCRKINAELYELDQRSLDFLHKTERLDLVNSTGTLTAKVWDKKVYQPMMDLYRDYISKNQQSLLDELNSLIFKTDWDKYAKGTLSAWEMEVLCFYYHEHELKNVHPKYGLRDFFKMPEDPIVEREFSKGGKTIRMFELSKICGTCIAKNKAKSSVSLLTTSGVVEIKFRKEYFSLFDKQISERQADGTKKVMEKSWFNRGSMIVVQGVRIGDTFIPKKYASSGGHQLYHITEILPDGDLVLQTKRYKGGIAEDD